MFYSVCNPQAEFFYGGIYVTGKKLKYIYLKRNGRAIIQNFNFSLERGDKVAVIGEEGGKVYLYAFKGQTGYMPQNYGEVLDFESTPWQFLNAADKAAQTKALTMLGNLKFSAEEMQGKIGDLSGSQQALTQDKHKFTR